jgi:anthranilate/para-aminobenzoate synthase component II
VRLTVRRNDQDFLADLVRGAFAGVVIVPGPSSPEDLGYLGHSLEDILCFGTQGLPVLGCLSGTYQGNDADFVAQNSAELKALEHCDYPIFNGDSVVI